ncbi:MAG: acetyltransferase [Chloroflexi bacterium]|nr:acetyltransferase [Chloroflexota bacterium]
MLHYIDLFPKDSARLEAHRSKTLGIEPYIHPTAIVFDSHIGSWTEVQANTSIIESTFDDYSYTAGDVSMIYSTVGKFCSIASHVRINPGNHPMHRVTQHHMTYRRKQYGFGDGDDSEIFDWRRSHNCVIGHDVWIGHGATIMPGVNVGIGAVIGAGAVVTKDVGSYEIAVGVPARVIRKRFAADVCEKLLTIAWWEWDHDTIKARFDDLLDTETFVEKYT